MIERTNSKELLAKSLLQLAKTKPLHKITVTEIAQNCSLTREAFYYHFADKYELMLWIYKLHTSEIVDKGIFKEPIINVWEKALKVMQDHSYFYEDAFEDPVFLDNLLKVFMGNLTSVVTFHAGKHELSNPDIKFAIRFYANGLLKMTIEWLKDVKKEDAYTISRRMCAIMPQVLLKYYIFES